MRRVSARAAARKRAVSGLSGCPKVSTTAPRRSGRAWRASGIGAVRTTIAFGRSGALYTPRTATGVPVAESRGAHAVGARVRAAPAPSKRSAGA
ncbi:hypothetical protein, partial [Salinibacter ruber]|uniref:hypothetical protein n=1 Tax=Salinibacter ruber TaxID=146919 RepID=UPI001F074B43